MTLFTIASLVAWAMVAIAARLLRGTAFAAFVSVIVGVYTLSAIAFAPLAMRIWPVWPVFLYLHVIVYVHLLLLARPRMRPLVYRILISIPASFFVAGTALALPWGVLGRLGFHVWMPWLPYTIALFGLWQSLSARKSTVHITLDRAHVDKMARHGTKGARVEKPLSLVQITDPHLGPFMSVERLRKTCERAVATQPDLILLTGDFLTMESQGDASHLTRALEPLQAMKGRTFACRGNHDHEAPAVVREALEKNGIRLLIDESEIAHTPWGDVEVLGFDFMFGERATRIAHVAQEHPRREGLVRVALLHDPGAFRHVPEGTADLVLSGHTHGGHLGFVSLGANWTVPRMVDMPDHGLWARGPDRLYVHRGNGHYGFPLRLGVPAEESVIYVHF